MTLLSVVWCNGTITVTSCTKYVRTGNVTLIIRAFSAQVNQTKLRQKNVYSRGPTYVIVTWYILSFLRRHFEICDRVTVSFARILQSTNKRKRFCCHLSLHHYFKNLLQSKICVQFIYWRGYLDRLPLQMSTDATGIQNTRKSRNPIIQAFCS